MYLEIVGDIVVFVARDSRHSGGFCLVRWGRLAVALLLERVARWRCLILCGGCHCYVEWRVDCRRCCVRNKEDLRLLTIDERKEGGEQQQQGTAGRSFQRHQSGVTFPWLSLTRPLSSYLRFLLHHQLHMRFQQWQPELQSWSDLIMCFNKQNCVLNI